MDVLEALWRADFEGLENRIPKPVLRGGRYEFEVANIDEAVALAQLFKDNGRYSYFRGQADSSWTFSSTLSRRAPEEQEQAFETLSSFWGWVESSSEMVPYLQSEDQILAAVQHHAVAPTVFIDLTRDPSVAGWFATHGAEVDRSGAIYLIDPERMRPIFDAFSKGEGVLRFVEVDVANLWRLQAQSGLFLHANMDVEGIWPVDRILFRQTGAPLRIAENKIYPDRESHLEQMIKQYLVMSERGRVFSKLIEGKDSPIIRYLVKADRAPPPDEHTPLPEHWTKGPNEHWSEIDTSPTDVEFQYGDLIADIEAVTSCVERRRGCTDLMRVIVDDERMRSRFGRLLDRLWAGMRPHPYSSEEIARAISALARFDVFFRDFDLGQGRGTMVLAADHLEDPLEIEMGLHGGGSTRCCVTAARLRAAFTDAGIEQLGLDRQAGSGALGYALIRAQGASLPFFDESRLRDLLVDEIIPWQILSERNPIIFAPSEIEALGLP